MVEKKVYWGKGKSRKTQEITTFGKTFGKGSEGDYSGKSPQQDRPYFSDGRFGKKKSLVH